MANRYWVGGAGTWDTTSTTHWSASSGGASGASVPTSADSVFFDALSGVPGTVTMTGTLNCLDFTTSVTAWTFATGTTPILNIYGSLSTFTGTTWSSGSITFNATTTGKTITTNGTSFRDFTFQGVSSVYTLQDNLTLTASFALTDGTFNANNKNVTASSVLMGYVTTRTLTMGSGTWTLTGAASSLNIWDSSVSTNLTLNTGTAAIVAVTDPTGSSTFSGGSYTFNSLTYTNSSGGKTGNSLITGGTFTTLTLPALTSTCINTFILSSITVGTLNIGASTNPTCNYVFQSSILGTISTLTITTFSGSSTAISFKDITVSGAAAPITGTYFGNCGNNSGITFATAKTVYWNLAGAQNWSATGWATSSGGTPAVANFPLAQDTAVFDNTGSVTGTITIEAAWNIGTIDMSARTSAMTLANSISFIVLGNWLNGSGTTLSGTTAISFQGRTTQQITSASKSFTQAITVNNISGTVQLVDALVTPLAITLISGTLNANNQNVTLGNFVSTGSIVRTITMGSGTWTTTLGGTVWTASGASNFTVNANTSTILIGGTVASTHNFNGGGLTWNNLTIGSTWVGNFTLAAANTFNTLTSNKTVAFTITFPSSVTQTISNWNVSGSATKLVTLAPSTAATVYTLAKAGGGVVSADYLSISYSTATPTSTWYAGTHSTNTAGNTGWFFTAPPSGGYVANSIFFGGTF